MHVSKRDLVATALVAVAAVLYLLWMVDATPTDTAGVRITGVTILALGFAASASAVVPSFDRLLHGNKTYLVMTSLIGLVALAAGVQMLITASGGGLTVMTSAMLVLWLIATIHHSMLTSPDQPGDIVTSAWKVP